MQEQTEWPRISFFGRQAEICGEYLRKGSAVYVEGRLQTRKWTDKDGNERNTTEVRGDRMQMLGGGAVVAQASPWRPRARGRCSFKRAAEVGRRFRRNGRRHPVLKPFRAGGTTARAPIRPRI